MRGAPSCPLPHCILAASPLVALWSSYPHHCGRYGFLKLQQLGTHHFSNPMVPHVNVLGSRMKAWILGKMNGTLVVTNRLYFSYLCPNSCKNFFIHKTSLQASTTAMYSAYVVDNEMHFCSFDFHDTSPPANVTKYPDVDFLESLSPA